MVAAFFITHYICTENILYHGLEWITEQMNCLKVILYFKQQWTKEMEQMCGTALSVRYL